LSDPIDVGVVGVGHLGKHHARLYAQTPGARLVGVVDQDRARAESIASEYGCRVFDSEEDLAAHTTAVSVAVPTQFHRDVAVRLLQAGVHVLVEKPLARSIDEAERINTVAEEQDLLVMVGHTERFNPAVRALFSAVQEPRFLEIHRLAAFSARSTDIDVVLDLMIHDLDLLLALDGSAPVSVDAAGIAALTDKIDIANARIRLESGCVANLTASRISPESVRRIRVFQARTYLSCDTGRRTVDRHQLVLQEDGSPKILHDLLPIEDAEPLAAELAAFVAAVRSGVRPSIDGRQGQRALELAHRVHEAIAEQRGSAGS
jgi:predicted dehydrogenase